MQVRWINLDSYFVYSLSGWDRHFNYLMPYVTHKRGSVNHAA